LSKIPVTALNRLDLVLKSKPGQPNANLIKAAAPNRLKEMLHHRDQEIDALTKSLKEPMERMRRALEQSGENNRPEAMLMHFLDENNQNGAALANFLREMFEQARAHNRPEATLANLLRVLFQ